jgi:hypothetical protein
MPIERSDFQHLQQICNQTFDKMTIVLDNRAHDGCLFNECKILYLGGPARVTECSFSPGCSFEIRGQAAFVVQTLSELGWKISPPGWTGQS